MNMSQILARALAAGVGGVIGGGLLIATTAMSQDTAQHGYGVNRNAAFAPALEAYEKGLAQECADFENGEMDIRSGGLQTVADFNGDGITDPVLDTGVYTCSSMASFNMGSGGRVIAVFVSSPEAVHGYQRFEFLGEGNVTSALGDRAILLLAQHGTMCGRTGAEICFGAYSWSDGAFVSAGGEVKPAP